ncbi:MAG: flagellar biosynthesis protein FlhB [Alphaproteobacteria bacterium]
MSENDQDQDQESKTEEPTERRIEKAYEEGKGIISKEVSTWIVFATAIFALLILLPYRLKEILGSLSFFLRAPIIRSSAIYTVTVYQLRIFFINVFVILGVIWFVPFLASYIQNRKFITPKILQPKLDKISIQKGWKKLFSKQSIMDLLKGILKIALIGSALYFTIRPRMNFLPAWVGLSLDEYLHIFYEFLCDVFILILVLLFIIAVIDYSYVYYQFFKNLRMTHQELKEEFKETEGHPEVKKKIRQLRQERAQQKMMATVPNATAVITNPTHLSVALLWDSKKMNAPKIVAKGQDYIALKIRDIARKHSIPVIENPPLARSLYDKVIIDQEIKQEHYKAVAEIIQFVMRIKKRV